jgi:hypothetical protein
MLHSSSQHWPPSVLVVVIRAGAWPAGQLCSLIYCCSVDTPLWAVAATAAAGSSGVVLCFFVHINAPSLIRWRLGAVQSQCVYPATRVRVHESLCACMSACAPTVPSSPCVRRNNAHTDCAATACGDNGRTQIECLQPLPSARSHKLTSVVQTTQPSGPISWSLDAPAGYEAVPD